MHVTGIDGVSVDNSSQYDWGFTLVPADVLTSQLVIGWAPGNAAVPPSDDDDDPVRLVNGPDGRPRAVRVRRGTDRCGT